MVDEDSKPAMALFEEHAVIKKHDVETGRVRVSTSTENIEQTIPFELESDLVEVVRVTKNESVIGDPPGIRTEGSVTIIPIFEEVVFVEKRLVLKEEIHIRRSRGSEKLEIPIMLRHQTADISRISPSYEAEPIEGDS